MGFWKKTCINTNLSVQNDVKQTFLDGMYDLFFLNYIYNFGAVKQKKPFFCYISRHKTHTDVLDLSVWKKITISAKQIGTKKFPLEKFKIV